MVYELWRDDSLNLSAAFKTEREALVAVCDEVTGNGPAIVLQSVLVRVDSRGKRTEIAEGQQRIDRALAASSPKRAASRVTRRPAISRKGVLNPRQ